MCLECTGCTSDAYESILDLGFLYVPTRALSFYAVQAKAQCGLLIAKKKRPPTSISCSPITCSTVLPGHAVKVHPRVGWQLSPIRKQNFFFLIGEAKRGSFFAFPLFTFFWSSALNSIIPFEPIQLYLSLLILIFLGRKPTPNAKRFLRFEERTFSIQKRILFSEYLSRHAMYPPHSIPWHEGVVDKSCPSLCERLQSLLWAASAISKTVIHLACRRSPN